MTANKEAASTDFVGIDVASKTIGVSPSTLRNWESKGKISSRRQPGGHRVYAVQDVLELAAKNGNPGKIIGSNEEEREIALDMVRNTYSLADASVLLDVSLETLRRWRDSGQLKACDRRLLGQIRYPKATVDALVAEAKGEQDLTG